MTTQPVPFRPAPPLAAPAPSAPPPAPVPLHTDDSVQHQFGPAYYTSDRPRVLDEPTVLSCLSEEEYGDAQMLAALYRGRLLYSYADKLWYLWGGHAWYEDQTDLTLQLVAGQLARQYLATSAELSPEVRTQKLADALANRALALRKLKRAQNVLNFAKGLLGIKGDEWDNDPWVLGVANGVLDLKTGALRDGKPEDYIRTISPTRWRGLDHPAPRFEQFIAEIFDENGDIAQFTQRLLGYGITGLSVEHVFPVLWGAKGRNGKDTLLETLKRCLGPLADTVSTDVLLATKNQGGAQPHVVDLKGKRLVWASETDMNARLNAAQVKLITGGGTIKTRQLYSRMIEFSPTHLVMLITNFKPKTSAEDDALWNRVLLLPFNLRFVNEPAAPDERKRDPHLVQKLSHERSGILAWLVRGCLEWQQTGLAVPDVVKASTEAYRNEVDTIGQFIDECCVVQSNAVAKASEIYHAYRDWCEEGGMQALNQRNFGTLLVKRFEKKRTGYYFVYIGVGLLDEKHDPMIHHDPISPKVPHEEKKHEKKSEKPIMMDHGIMSPPPGQGAIEGGEGEEEVQLEVQLEPVVPQPPPARRPVPRYKDVNQRLMWRRDMVSLLRSLLRSKGTPQELGSVDADLLDDEAIVDLIWTLEGR